MRQGLADFQAIQGIQGIQGIVLLQDIQGIVVYRATRVTADQQLLQSIIKITLTQPLPGMLVKLWFTLLVLLIRTR